MRLHGKLRLLKRSGRSKGDLLKHQVFYNVEIVAKVMMT